MIHYISERHQHLKDGKRSSRSPVYVRSIGIHGHHGITKGIEHDLFYDSVLNSSPQNDETGYNKGGATSGASKQSSWINVFANTIVGAIKGVSQFISSPFKPAIGMEHSKPSKTVTTQGTDVNGTLFLLDVFIRKITGQKYVSIADQPTISLPEAVFYASDIINGFEKAVEQAASKSGMSMHRLVDIDSMEMREEITGKIMGGKFNEIPGVLISYAEKACPGKEAGCPGRLSEKKFDKFTTIFNNRINITLGESILQILHSEHNKSKVKNIEEQQRNLKDKKQPRSYLDDSSVQGLLTQAVVSK